MSNITVYPLDVVLAVLNDKDGKDKSAKIIQYSCRLIVAFLRSDKKPKALLALISQLSMFRKIIRLGNWLATYREMHLKGLKKLDLGDLADLYTEVADDIYCLSKMGIFSPKLGHKAEFHAIHGWFLSILVGLYKQWTVYIRTGQLSTLKVSKLLSDGIFCFIDVIEWSAPRASNIQTIFGLNSAFLSYYKIYKSVYTDVLREHEREHEHDHDAIDLDTSKEK